MKHAASRRNVTIAVMVATFLTAMDSTVVSTAMPTIVSDLGGLKLISWVFAVYLLTMAVTTPIWGKLADLYGRKSVFTVGTALFLVGSTLSGLSGTMTQLIWFRAFQGIGAGAVFPITLTIIGDIYSFSERARIQGLFSAIWGISGILGPLVGGFFTDHLTWRWIFYINMPIGLLSMILVWVFLQEQFERKRKAVDYGGAITFSIGTAALLYALLSGGQTYPWSSVAIFGLFVAAAVFLLLFLWVETRVAEPMLPLQLFQNRVIVVSNIASFLTSAILIGINAYLPLWIQGIMGHTATNAGLTLTPMSIGWPIGSTLGGRLMLKIGSRTTAIIGSVALIVGSVWLGAVHIGSPQWVMVAIMIIVGFGFGFATTAFTVVVQSVVSWEMRGAATASNQFVRSLGQTIGIAAFGTWFNHAIANYTAAHYPTAGVHAVGDFSRLLNPQFAAHAPSSVLVMIRQALAVGLHDVFVIMAVIAVVSFFVTIWLPQHKSDPSAKPTNRETVVRTATASQE